MRAARRFRLVLVILALAGCAAETPPTPETGPILPTPSSTPSATPPATPAPTPPPTTPPGGGLWEGLVEVDIAAEPTESRAGEEIRITLAARNHMTRSLWTNPAVGCTGSWDLQVYDADGTRLRVDDRDAMGCPSTDTYATEMRAGGEAGLTLAWDGMLRPSLGQSEPAPPGEYVLRGIVRYATESGPSNGSGPSAREEAADVTVRIVA